MRSDTQFIQKTKQELSCKIMRTMVNYVREKRGEVAVQNLIETTELDEAYLQNENNWVSFDVYTRACEYVKKEFNDPKVLYKIGVYSFSNLENFGTIAKLGLSLLTPDAVYKKTAEIGNQAQKFGKYRIVEIEKNRMLLEFKNEPGYKFYLHNCDYRMGVFSGLPQLYQLPMAKHRSIQCVGKGDDRCLYEFAWQSRNWQLFGKRSLIGLWMGLAAMACVYGLNNFVLDTPIHGIKLSSLFLMIILYLIGMVLDMKAVAKQNAEFNAGQSADIQNAIEFANEKYKEASDTVAKLETIIEANAVINTKLVGSELTDVVLEIIKDRLGYDRAMIVFYNKEKNNLSNAKIIGDLTREQKSNMHLTTFDLNDQESAHTKVFTSGQPLLIRNVNDHEGLRDNPIIRIANTQSFVMLPFRIGQRIVGTLTVDKTVSANPMSEDDVKILSTLLNMLSIALENAELYKDLEGRVLIRTQQLHEVNAQLESAYQELQQAHSQLLHSEKMASIGKLVAGIAHEMNNPAGILSGYVELIELYSRRLGQEILDAKTLVAANPELVAKFNQFEKTLEEIHTCIDPTARSMARIKSIIQDLRNFSRLDESEFLQADLNQGLNNTLKFFKDQTEGRIEIIRKFSDLPMVACYAGHLNQVFANVILNSIEAIKDKGVIEIKTQVRKADSDINKSHVRIDIKDTGQGISKENVGKIFDPFFTTKDVGKGKGLGLSIAYGVINRHRGKIYVSSDVGKGTTVSILIPINTENIMTEA
jgi:two-component system NtrC family sensor kinase